MLNMNILYDTLNRNGTMQLNRTEFLRVLIPEELYSLQNLYGLLQEQSSYKSNFFKGKLDARGLAGPVRDILDDLNENPESLMNQVTGRCAFFLEQWGRNKNSDVFAQCLAEWAAHIEEDSVLSSYISIRKSHPEYHADILAVLYLYCITLWKSDLFMQFLSAHYRDGMSDGWSLSVERAECFASCGKEATVVRTELQEEHGVKWLDVKMNFGPTRIRPELPDWASVVIKLQPPRDLRYYHSVMFQLDARAEENQGCGTRSLTLELHGADKNVPYEYRTVAMHAGRRTVSVMLQDMNPDVLKQAAEICFVVNLCDLNMEEDDPDLLHCHFRIAQIRLN